MLQQAECERHASGFTTLDTVGCGSSVHTSSGRGARRPIVTATSCPMIPCRVDSLGECGQQLQSFAASGCVIYTRSVYSVMKPTGRRKNQRARLGVVGDDAGQGRQIRQDLLKRSVRFADHDDLAGSARQGKVRGQGNRIEIHSYPIAGAALIADGSARSSINGVQCMRRVDRAWPTGHHHADADRL